MQDRRIPVGETEGCPTERIDSDRRVSLFSCGGMYHNGFRLMRLL